MSTLFKLGRSARNILFAAAGTETRRKLRRLGMGLLTWPPYLACKRNQLSKTYPGLTDEERALIAKVDCRVSWSDTMFEGDVTRYLLVGLSGLKACEQARVHCPHLVIKSILDFPSGAGRVGRFLTARFPQAKITACDVDTDMVDFCGEVLGMERSYSQVDFARITFERRFDLIWCGSLVTHLDGERILDLFRLFERSLNEGGVMVFTTHGDYVAERVSKGYDYGIGQQASEKAVELYRQCGFAFMPYLRGSEDQDYGFSITSPGWIRSQCAMITTLKEVSFQAQGYDCHQDVYGFSRFPT